MPDELIPEPLERTVTREKLIAKIEDASLMALEKLIDAGKGVPHSAELVESVMKMCCGTNGYAALLLTEFFQIEPGKPGRTRILELIARLVQHNTDAGGASKPKQLMSTEELESELQNRLKAEIVEMGGPRLLQNIEADERVA